MTTAGKPTVRSDIEELLSTGYTAHELLYAEPWVSPETVIGRRP